MNSTPKILSFCLILQLFIPSVLSAGNMIPLLQDSVPLIHPDSSARDSKIRIDTFLLDIFPPSSGIQFYKDGIVFLSMSKNEERMVPEHISFGTFDNYYAIPGDSTVGKHTAFSPSLAFPHPSEAFTFTGDYLTMYFAKPLKKGNREKIFKAEFISGNRNLQEWKTNDNPLPFCTGDYSYTHPALSKDGKILIFASDNSGAIGGMDLFMSRYEDNRWTDPKNLGPEINSIGNEFFPYLDTANNLFYSSDGIPGYGGYDLFVSRFNGKSWDEPVNLSANVNSGNDDIAIKISRTDNKTAFYTVRQPFRNAEMQLFRITLDSIIALSDTAFLSDILYTMAVSENEFPSRKIMAFIDTSRIIPLKTAGRFELDQEEIDVSPEEEIVMHLDTIVRKTAEVPVKIVPPAGKESTSEPRELPVSEIQPVAEVPVKETPFAVEQIITPPLVQLVPLEPVTEIPIKETPAVREEILTTPPVALAPVEPPAETLPKETVKEEEIIVQPPAIIIPPETVIEPPVKETPVIREEITTPPPVVLVPVVPPAETPPKETVKEEEIIVQPPAKIIPPEIVVEPSVIETPVIREEITTPPLVVLVPVEPPAETPPEETTVKKEEQVQIAPVMTETKESGTDVIYKVQVKSAIRSIGNFNINVNDRKYTTSEYFYKNEYRYTVGEFRSLAQAVQLQNACRHVGYPKAFVVAFENNARTLDKSRFRLSREEITASVSETPTEPQIQLSSTTPLPETARVTIPESMENLDIIVYKVQFLSTVKSKGDLTVNVKGKKYQASEYLYKGEYRYTIGEFNNIIPAIELQYACRRAGYPKAFVVVFKNNMRTLDPELFMKE